MNEVFVFVLFLFIVACFLVATGTLFYIFLVTVRECVRVYRELRISIKDKPFAYGKPRTMRVKKVDE